ncbi:coiled-coil domain-containing protein 137 [Galleria mellonella]|uniref:Coiled-coil domain-containing protein 137 n=1 Tax=Galleria mellonella TaxID=7137 RepID=A0ABM3MHF9_GALME|nr:coiled-coil domain-containing protein 137 [Galleria mellonella]
MGRKIPAKKHRGVKDPLEQNARRLQILKTKINAPPKDPDDQPVPRSLINLFAFRDKDKKQTGNKKKRKHHVSVTDDGNKKSLAHNPVARLRKLPGESGRDFTLRINGAIRALHNAAEPQHYPQDLEEDDVKGERMAAQRERRERKRKRAAAARAGPAAAAAPPPLSRAQRLALKKKEKKLRALDADAPQYERVPFGEAAAAPPALPRPRRAAAAAPRPGQRDLLLKQLLHNKPSVAEGEGEVKQQKHRPLAEAERMRRERARLEAVAAYRALKIKPNKQK